MDIRYKIVIRNDAEPEITYSESQGRGTNDATGPMMDENSRVVSYRARIEQIFEQLRESESALNSIVEQWRDTLDEDSDPDNDEEDVLDELESIASDLDSVVDDLEDFMD